MAGPAKPASIVIRCIAVKGAVRNNAPMLGFLDESGDTGLKVARGSSRFLVMALVTFDDDAEALRCDQRIDRLRQELRLAPTYEFHFAKNAKRIRPVFLEAVSSFDYGYHVLTLDKDPQKLGLIGISDERGLYERLAGFLVENARPFLVEATILVDRRGSRQPVRALTRHFRSIVRSNEEHRAVKTVRQQDSHRNNLLQLADYVAGISMRAIAGEGEALALEARFLRGKRLTRDVWPK